MHNKKQKQLDDLSLRKNDNHTIFNNFSDFETNNSSIIICQSGHKFNCVPGWITNTRIYDHFVLHYVVSGKGTFYTNSKNYTIQQGDLFLIRPFSDSHYQADYEYPWSYYWVGLKGIEAPLNIKACGFKSSVDVINYGINEDVIDIFIKLAYPKLSPPLQEYEHLSNIYLLFSYLIQENSEKNTSIYGQYLTSAINYIYQHYASDTLSVSAISKHIGIDRTHLYRIFNDQLNQSVQSFILEFRLKKAVQLIKDTSITMREVTEQCGFESQSHFSTIFKKYYNISPLKYRKKYFNNK